MKKILKKEKGITLVALVITVIIMLIIAGVAISSLTTDGGMFSKTQSAVEKYNNAVKLQDEKIATLTNEMNEYFNKYSKDDGENDVSIATTVKIGDYINYDAGTWSEADMTKITSSAGSPTVNRSTNKPSSQGEFGGFTVGQSRNTNSTPHSTSYMPRTSGWRVWDIDSASGIVTIISAGHPETYYHADGQSTASINILRNRDCSMYVNKYATSAHILTGQEAVTWYNKQFGTNYTIIENGGMSSTFYRKTFTTAEPISVLENGSYYWLASAYSADSLYNVGPSSRNVYYNLNSAFGVRLLVSLKSDVLLEIGIGDGSEENPWRIAENQ